MFGFVFRLFYQLGSIGRKLAVPEKKHFPYWWVCQHCKDGNKFEVSGNTTEVVERMIAIHMRTVHGKAR